jgi:hypothetical protein
MPACVLLMCLTLHNTDLMYKTAAELAAAGQGGPGSLASSPAKQLLKRTREPSAQQSPSQQSPARQRPAGVAHDSSFETCAQRMQRVLAAVCSGAGTFFECEMAVRAAVLEL